MHSLPLWESFLQQVQSTCQFSVILLRDAVFLVVELHLTQIDFFYLSKHNDIRKYLDN